MMYLADILKHDVKDLPDWAKEIRHYAEEWLNPAIDFIEVATSGSTGAPKMMRHSKASVRASIQHTVRALALENCRTAALVIPVSKVGGRMMVYRALEQGWELICIQPSLDLSSIITCSVDFISLIDIQLQQLIKEKDCMSTWACILLGGGPMSAQVAQAAELQGWNLWHSYGMTETLSHVALRRYNESSFQLVDLSISVQLDERECAQFTVPYLDEPVVTTNDLIQLESDGRLTVLGRVDGVINSGGLKLIPEQLEAAWHAFIPCPFYLTSEPDEQLGQRLVLVLESNDPIEILWPNEIPRRERPKRIIYRDQFERTVTGKIIRK